MTISGFQTISRELGQGKAQIEAILRKMFANSTADENVNVKTLTEAYHMYKRKYLEHLSFNPKGEKLGKFIVTRA